MRLFIRSVKYNRAGMIDFMLAFFLPMMITTAGILFPAPVFSEEVVPPAMAQLILSLGDADRDIQEEAVYTLGKSGDPEVLPVLEALRGGDLYFWTDPSGKNRIVISGDAVDLEDGTQVLPLLEPYSAKPILDLQGDAIQVVEEILDGIRLSRRMRINLTPMLDRLRLFSREAAIRESAATKVGLSGNPEVLPLLERAGKEEENRWVSYAIQEAIFLILLFDEDPAERKKAAETLGSLHAMNAVPMLEDRILNNEAGESEETDIAVKAAIKDALQKIESWSVWTRTVETIFSGISLSSILLIVALGLAITFGLMGVINMAHGELMMLGAYTTYVIQELFIAYLPSHLRDFYFILSIPLAFAVAAFFGLLMEKAIIRKLYGRPLETLLATWGISLVLQQGVRQIFGAANVDVASPAWLSGGIRVVNGIQFPYNRLFIIALSIASVFSVYLLVLRSPIGLKIRAVTQNRQMSACMGIATERVDAWTFALGAGLAGMAGSALTLIGNVGPDLGQNYIVDSFLVVVTGGVGKLAGTVGAAFGIGGMNKLLEPSLGAIYAKVAILLIVILFLQKRPSGLFPAKGRSLDL